MPLPAVAAVVARVAGSAVAKSAAKTVAKAAVVRAVTSGGSDRPGHAALSQNQFPNSPQWGQ